MHHDAHGWWIAEAGEPPLLDPLPRGTSAAAVVVGGGVDAWYRAAPHWEVSAAPAQDGVGSAAIDGSEVVALSAEETRARCDSPLFRGAVEVRTGATVHPARLAFGLRDRLVARGVRVFEGSRGGALRGATALTSSRRGRAGAAIVG